MMSESHNDVNRLSEEVRAMRAQLRKRVKETWKIVQTWPEWKRASIGMYQSRAEWRKP